MLLRLIFGLVKGLVIGGLLGFALAKVGLAAPGPFAAYAFAALAGVIVGLVAGKPIWSVGGKIEAGLKAGFGALLAAGLLWLTRSYLAFSIPFDLGSLAEANRSLGESGSGTFGGLAITSLPFVAAVLGAFYDADNTPDSGSDAKGSSSDKRGGAKPPQRIAPGPRDTSTQDGLGDEFELEDEAPAPKRRAGK